VRIIAGELRGRRIDVPRGVELRPTYDRVRESVFSTIAELLPGAQVLDLFAGTGSLGIESVSRGAAGAVFVERDPRVVAHLRGALEELGVGDRCRVLRSDAVRFVMTSLRGGPPFDVVFADPPYDSGMARRTYDALDDWDGVVAGGLVVIEHRADDRLPEEGGRLTLRTVKRYGTIEVELHDVAAGSGGVTE
jgi:16S rRNA (guanine966-N2)-methyltransferase